MRLNYDLETVDERRNFLVNLLEEYPNPTSRELEMMADYIIFSDGGVEKKGPVLTDNRMVTVNKRETSMEGLTEKLEGGESAFHALVKEDKNMILTPKVSITDKDLEEIPDLKQLRESILALESQLSDMPLSSRPRAKKAIIEMRKDQYAIKAAFRKPMYPTTVLQTSTVYCMNSDTGYVGSDGTWTEVSSNFVDLWNPKHISQLIANYSTIKEETWENLDSELRWTLVDLEETIDQALENEPIYREILILKIDKASNEDIQKALIEKFDTTHSQEYISSLYRNKIPQLIVDKLKENWVDYVYTYHLKGNYKTCTRCGEVKLALNRYFSINRTSSSKFYSICKECRNNQK